MNKPKILVLLPFICYPLNSGGTQGAFHMLNYIKDFFDVHIWFHINNESKSRQLIDALDNALNHKCHLHWTANKIGRNFITARALYRKFCRFFLKNDPQYCHNSQLWGEGSNGYCDIASLEDINRIIEENDIQLVQVEFIMLLDIVYALPKSIKKIFIHHELGFARKQTWLSGMSDRYIYDNYCYNKQFVEEIAALNHYDLVVTMSDIDKTKLIQAGCTSHIESSPLFIPTKQNTYPEFRATSSRLTYIASSKHAPNVEGLIWFIKNIHPLLAETGYHLEVIGSGWQETHIPLEIPKNITFKGFVQDLTTVVPGSIMIVPILSGSGMRMKILEAINNSVPFISTTIGAEGLPFNNGQDCYIEDSPEQFAKAIAGLLQNPELQQKFVKLSRENFEKTHSPKALGQRRVNLLQSVK